MFSTLHRPEYQVFCDLLEEARKAKGITQVQLAERVGKNQSHIQKSLAGSRRLDVLEGQQWADALGLTPTEWSDLLRQALKSRRVKSKRG